ncbi:hypothetical protein ACOTJL_19455 [Achromobacter xylosoxidans]
MTTKPTPDGWDAQPAATAPKITHGGPAFPVPLHPGQSYQGHAPCDGMTLRDYFAAKAMAQAMALRPARWWQEGVTTARSLPDMGQCARVAYAMADAMLAARGAR